MPAISFGLKILILNCVGLQIPRSNEGQFGYMRKRIHHQILTRYKPTYFVMRKKIQLSLCGVLLCTGTALAQGGFHHPGMLHSTADFEAVKTRVRHRR